jgi:hypothetical protein
MTATTMTPAARAPARRTLLLLAAVFILPFAIGTGLFWLDWRPGKFANYGELLQPPLRLPDSGLRHVDGRPLPTAELHGKWLLVMPVSGQCDSTCQDTLQHLRQVHLALNKEQSRLQQVLIGRRNPDQGDDAVWAELAQRFPDLVLATTPADAARPDWTRLLGGAGHETYIIDPLGNAIMRYRDPVDKRGVLKDLERLLKYSWIR